MPKRARKPSGRLTFRAPRPGDFGFVAHRHGALYASEQRYDARFEAVVARALADFVDHFDPVLERGWIAELDGRFAGCIFLVKKSPRVAKLRMLLVEPSARGHGLGTQLIDHCVAFARDAGYRKITLWTHRNLRAARRLYARAGFELVESVHNPSFGRDLWDETWELQLVP